LSRTSEVSMNGKEVSEDLAEHFRKFTGAIGPGERASPGC
jgi:hypothetical protein